MKQIAMRVNSNNSRATEVDSNERNSNNSRATEVDSNKRNW